MKNNLLAPALAAVAMFIFGSIFWMSLFPYKVISPNTDDRSAAAALDAIFPETGLYLVPGPHLDPQEAEELFNQGPSAMVHFVKEGGPMMDPMVFLKGYLHYFVIAFLLGIILRKSVASFQGYSCAVKFSTFIGFTGAALTTLGQPIWWHHLWSWAFINLLYATLSFTVAGLVLAKFLPKKETPAK